MPNLPTLSESGMPGFELLSWYGIWGPAGLPASVTDRLNAEIRKAVQAATLQAKFAEMSFVPALSTPSEFRQMIADDLANIGKAVKEAGIRID